MSRFFRFRKVRLAVLAVFFAGLISCTFIKNLKPRYFIACPIEWSTIELYSQDKQVTGFLSDLMQDISHEEGIEIRLTFVREAEAVALVNEEICDGYFTAMPRTFTSEKNYYFSSPLFTSGYLILVKKDSSFQTLEESKEANIGVSRASLNKVLSFVLPGWRTYIYDTIYQAMNDVKKGSIDGVLVDSLEMPVLTTGIYANAFRPLYPALSPHEIRVVALKTPKGADLVRLINKGRARLQEKGAIGEHLQYWGLTSLTAYGEK